MHLLPSIAFFNYACYMHFLEDATGQATWLHSEVNDVGDDTVKDNFPNHYTC